MPPLRERLEDIPILSEELLKPLAKEVGRPLPRISPRALKKLASYPWPGNVRELRNVLERTLLTLNRPEIQTEDLVLEAPGSIASEKQGAFPHEEWEIRPLDEVLARYAAASVKATGGNIRKAARRLEISPSTLYAKLRQSES
jgi:DNA-binding NtrC family response regulator